MAKLNFNKPVVTLNGTQLQQVVQAPSDEKNEDNSPKLVSKTVGLFFYDVVVTALLKDDTASTDDKIRRGKLAQQIYNDIEANEGVEVSLEDRTMIRNLVGQHFSPLYVVQVNELVGG